MDNLYTELFNEIKKPMVVVGCAKLTYSRSTYITRAPIHGERMFYEKYFEDGEATEENLSIAFIGVVSNFNDVDLREINSKLSPVLYNNPAARDSELLSHTHALTLNSGKLCQLSQIRARMAEKVVHLYADSLISQAEFEVYAVDDVREYS